jgi:hypothetical protein
MVSKGALEMNLMTLRPSRAESKNLTDVAAASWKRNSAAKRVVAIRRITAPLVMVFAPGLVSSIE